MKRFPAAVSFVKIGTKLISIRTCPSHCPIWVKFGISSVHTVLLSTCECRENRQMEGPNLI